MVFSTPSIRPLILSHPCSPPANPFLNQSVASTPLEPWSKKLFSLDHIPERQRLLYFPPVCKGEIDVAVCSREEVDKTEESWKEAIHGFFADKRPFFPSFLLALKKSWKVKGSVEIFQNSDESIIFTFSSLDERNRNLGSGPWLILGRYLHLRPWSRSVRSRKDFFETLPIWIRFPNLPLHLWSPGSIGKIASVVGKPLYLDNISASSSMIRFVRVCVEIAANKSLLTSVKVKAEDSDEPPFDQIIEFESSFKICDSCNVFGHVAGECNKPVVFSTLVSKNVHAKMKNHVSSQVPVSREILESFSLPSKVSSEPGHPVIPPAGISELPSEQGWTLVRRNRGRSRYKKSASVLGHGRPPSGACGPSGLAVATHDSPDNGVLEMSSSARLVQKSGRNKNSFTGIVDSVVSMQNTVVGQQNQVRVISGGSDPFSEMNCHVETGPMDTGVVQRVPAENLLETFFSNNSDSGVGNTFLDDERNAGCSTQVVGSVSEEIQKNLNVKPGEKETSTLLEGGGIMPDHPIGLENFCHSQELSLVIPADKVVLSLPNFSEKLVLANCFNSFEPNQTNLSSSSKTNSGSPPTQATNLFTSPIQIGKLDPTPSSEFFSPSHQASKPCPKMHNPNTYQAHDQPTTNPKSYPPLVQPTPNPNANQPFLGFFVNDSTPNADNLPLVCEGASNSSAINNINLISEEEELASGPPGFNPGIEKSTEENSIETTIHVTKETSESEEGVVEESSESEVGENDLSPLRARLVREKLGKYFPGTRNADRAFNEFYRFRKLEIESNRKKSVVPDAINQRNQGGKRVASIKGESVRKKKF